MECAPFFLVQLFLLFLFDDILESGLLDFPDQGFQIDVASTAADNRCDIGPVVDVLFAIILNDLLHNLLYKSFLIGFEKVAHLRADTGALAVVSQDTHCRALSTSLQRLNCVLKLCATLFSSLSMHCFASLMPYLLAAHGCREQTLTGWGACVGTKEEHKLFP